MAGTSGKRGSGTESLRLAIADLVETFGADYPDGPRFLTRLEALEKQSGRPSGDRHGALRRLRREALLANPLLRFGRLLLVKRAVRKGGDWKELGLPDNHRCNSCLPRTAYDNEIAVLSPIGPDGELTTLYRPKDGGYVGELDLHWNADRLLFARSDRENWKIWEIGTDGTSLRKVSRAPADVDCFDPCYLPDGRIIFGSTASYQAVPCWHGQQKVANLYLMEADGSGMRQLCFDQDHDFHPSVRNDGQILFHRWDYTGINHIYLRQLMVMHADGTGQRAVYGSNSWYPNALYFPRALPGRFGKLISILSGYHGVPRMGQLVLIDTSRGSYGDEGIVARISGRGDPVKPMIRDALVDGDWPKFLHPYPLNDKYFLVSCWMDRKSLWGIYLADVFDNLLLVREEPGYALLEPVPLRRQPTPPVIHDRADLSRHHGTVYLHDVHAGPGLDGVPRGTVKTLRVLSYHFGYPGLAGPDKIGYGGPWEVMRILGTVPVEEDGSAIFRVPANTPVAVQALDAEGKAVQLMRSWFTVMPGEYMSCVGCHERASEAPGSQMTLAARKPPVDIKPWYGPARGFDFERDVQPALDKYCVSCHDGKRGADGGATPDLRSIHDVESYRGRKITSMGTDRLHPKMRGTKGILGYTPAYDALLPYIRRVGIEDDVSLLVPGEYSADTSELIQMLRKGHGGVRLDLEAWDRLITWIDLNGPCHGTWGQVHPHPTDAHRRRVELRKLYGGPTEDPEAAADSPRPKVERLMPSPMPKASRVQLTGWPLDPKTARKRQAAAGPSEKTVDLGGGVSLKLVRIPPGEFVMGDRSGYPDERPLTRVAIAKAFWMGACEITNEQFRRFDPTFDCGYYAKLHGPRGDDRGLPLNGPDQPVVRVSWEQALGFCRWLSERTGLSFTLPTEARWEYACRAGSATPLSYGETSADFSTWSNLGDRAYAGLKIVTGGLHHLDPQGRALCDARFDDEAPVTSSVGSYRPNVWGLHDMHGNAAEWTLTTYRPYPYRDDDGRNALAAEGRKVVRGGSFFDRPQRSRSALRLSYPAWRRVFNVGFRVACEDEKAVVLK